jgi:hypothetical protein
MSVTPEQLERAFYAETDGSFVWAKAESTDQTNPAITIARIAFGERVAEPLVADAEVTEVAGGNWLRPIAKDFGGPDGYGGIGLHPNQAIKLAEIGQRILDLNAEGAVQPPLLEDEIAGIEHVITVVDGVQDMAMAVRP